MNIYAEKMLRAHQGEELIGCILAMEPRQAATSRIEFVFIFIKHIERASILRLVYNYNHFNLFKKDYK